MDQLCQSVSISKFLFHLIEFFNFFSNQNVGLEPLTLRMDFSNFSHPSIFSHTLILPKFFWFLGFFRLSLTEEAGAILLEAEC